MKVKDIMTKKVITVSPKKKVKEVAALLVKKRINGVPVVDKRNNLQGIITEADLIYKEKRIHIPTVLSILDGYIFLDNPAEFNQYFKKALGIKAQDIMTKKVTSVNENTEVEDAADIMLAKRIHLLPVLKGKKLIGVISKKDIMKAMILSSPKKKSKKRT